MSDSNLQPCFSLTHIFKKRKKIGQLDAEENWCMSCCLSIGSVYTLELGL